MNHPREEVLALAAANDLPLVSAWQTRRHLAHCAECRATVEAYAQMRVELSALPVPEPPADLATSILAAVPREERAPRGIPWFAWAAASAVAVAAVALVTLNPAPVNVKAPPVFQVHSEPPALAVPSAPEPRPVPAPAPTSKFTTLEAAEKDRDVRYLAASAKTVDTNRWESKALPPLVGPRAELLRTHALPGHVEIVALPGSPVQIVSAEALFAEGHLIDPVVEIRNTGSRPIKDCQLIWVVRDASGNEFRGTIVAANKPLAPGARAKYAQSIVLQPERRGAETQIAAARVFVRAASTADTVWVPERAALEASNLGGFVPLLPASVKVVAQYRSQGAKAFANRQR
jgi:hypothetical protein